MVVMLYNMGLTRKLSPYHASTLSVIYCNVKCHRTEETIIINNYYLLMIMG